MIHPQLKALLKEASVSFNAGNHTYQNKTTGEFYKGCTTIADSMEKPFLAPWYAKEMANAILSVPFDAVRQMQPEEFASLINDAKKAATVIADKAKEDGTAAHDWIEGFIASKVDLTLELPPTPESKEARNAINAFVMWAKAHDIIWLASEEVVSSDVHRTAGRLDALAIVDGIPSIVDFKTSKQISESYPLQCAGYHIMLSEMGFAPRQWIILRVPKDGNSAETLTINDRQDMQFFQDTYLHLIEAHKYLVYLENQYKSGEGYARRIKVDGAKAA
jgi:hypothetical protein